MTDMDEQHKIFTPVGCPDARCRHEFENIQEFVYGDKPGTGLVGEINKVEAKLKKDISDVKECCKEKIPKGWLWKFIVVFGISIITGGFYVFYRINSSSLEFITRAESVSMHQQLDRDLMEAKLARRLLEERYTNICTQLADIKSAVSQMNKRLDRASNQGFFKGSKEEDNDK